MANSGHNRKLILTEKLVVPADASRRPEVVNSLRQIFRSKLMKSSRFILLLLLIVAPAYATSFKIDTEESVFKQDIQSPYFVDYFNSYTYGSLIVQSLPLIQDNYTWAVMSADKKLYSGNGNMSTNRANDFLVIDFLEPITAVGGYFWPTDILGNNLAYKATEVSFISLDDVIIYQTILNSGNPSFLGFISLDGTAVKELQISVLGCLETPRDWPTVDNLYAGSAKSLVGGDNAPIPNPEPSTIMLMSTGICGIGIILRRKNK
jgi:hypothetical protein